MIHEWEEIDTDTFIADVHGIEVAVFPTTNPFDDGFVHHMQRWTWRVMPTGRRSEFPELFDLGYSASADKAKVAGLACAARADRQYQTAGKDGW